MEGCSLFVRTPRGRVRCLFPGNPFRCNLDAAGVSCTNPALQRASIGLTCNKRPARVYPEQCLHIRAAGICSACVALFPLPARSRYHRWNVTYFFARSFLDRITNSQTREQRIPATMSRCVQHHMANESVLCFFRSNDCKRKAYPPASLSHLWWRGAYSPGAGPLLWQGNEAKRLTRGTISYTPALVFSASVCCSAKLFASALPP